jgi:outer membrane lipoprotein-sorting protein
MSRFLAVPSIPALPLRSPERRRLLALTAGGLLAVCCAGPGLSLAAAAFDVAALMRTLARARAGEATFVERREVAMLDRTVESSGRLSFEAPDTFVRETLRPRPERLAVKGNTVTMTQGGRTRSMELDASPQAAVLVEAVRGTLTGNRDALERHFDASVAGTPEKWTLQLVPRDARLRGQVASVEVRGEQALVREITVWLADGDRTVMTITPLEAKAAARPAAARARTENPPRASTP